MASISFAYSLFIIFFVTNITASAQAEATVTSTDQRLREAQQAYRHGALDTAIEGFGAAAQGFGERGQSGQQLDALLRLAELQIATGQPSLAKQNLMRAQAALAASASLNDAGDPKSRIVVEASLGNAYLALGDLEQASALIGGAANTAKMLSDPKLEAFTQGQLGSLSLRQSDYGAAYRSFTRSATLAKQTGQHLLHAKSLVNANEAALKGQYFSTLKQGHARAMKAALALPPSRDKAYLLLLLGRQSSQASEEQGERRDASKWQSDAHQALTGALEVARGLNDKRAIAYTLGYLGQLYEQTSQFDEALKLSLQAAFAAQEVEAPEVLYRWQWQTGRILRQQGELDGAITAYREAVVNLQKVRQQLLRYPVDESSFRESIQPVFFELADLLLQRPKGLKDPSLIQKYLAEARDILELQKGAELEDYFQDDCVTSLKAKVTRLEQQPLLSSAVIYPILLDERTEVLLILDSGIKQFTVPVNREDLTQAARVLRRQLESGFMNYLPPAQKLYDWLIRPMEATLKSSKIDTLVVIPDGPLRTIPMAALHDGQRFIIQDYAFATTPSLTLTDPQPLTRQETQVLLAGLTRETQGFPALPQVAQELASIKQLYKGSVLKDETFVVSNMENTLTKSAFRMVHIATHGQFDSDPNNTFLLTFNDKLNMDRLEGFLAPSRFEDRPVELLTLSACQTAMGDDRAALGLAGIAIKAGVRSALASLWAIADESTSLLIGEFYRQLYDDSTPSKAKALQRAQLSLLEQNEKYQHPSFWSPFLLIGNWR